MARPSSKPLAYRSLTQDSSEPQLAGQMIAEVEASGSIAALRAQPTPSQPSWGLLVTSLRQQPRSW